MMIFPFISIGRMHLDEVPRSVGLSLGGLRQDKALFPVWRLQLDRLSELEFREVDSFIRIVKTEQIWSVSLGRTSLHQCLMIEARKADWHGRDGISGWIIFSADRVDGAVCGATTYACF